MQFADLQKRAGINLYNCQGRLDIRENLLRCSMFVMPEIIIIRAAENTVNAVADTQYHNQASRGWRNSRQKGFSGKYPDPSGSGIITEPDEPVEAMRGRSRAGWKLYYSDRFTGLLQTVPTFHFKLMKVTFFDFEQPIADLESKIEELRFAQEDSAVDISEEITRLQQTSEILTASIYANLTPWQISQVSRHPQRPYTLDYIQYLFSDFEELHGDRNFADDHAIVGGVARFNGQSVVVIGHQKGRDTKEKIYRNFGMPKPEGYRKALRLMRLAEKFSMPVFTFIDTPGAYPGIDAEERGQSEAIGRNLYVMTELKVPVICTIIGEGGSGGALAVAVGDATQMLEYSTYSVISPEGCASILWKSANKAAEAAEIMGITAPRLKSMGLIDTIISEPLGGAHRDYALTMQAVRKVLQNSLRYLHKYSTEALLRRRFERLMAYGQFKEIEAG